MANQSSIKKDNEHFVKCMTNTMFLLFYANPMQINNSLQKLSLFIIFNKKQEDTPKEDTQKGR